MNWNFLRYKIHQNWNGIEKHGEENIMELEELKKIGNSIGFFKVEELNIDKIKLLPEVRQMCSTDKCHMYGRNWSCPPACGTLEECAADIFVYKKGIIVQTKGELEDEFDGEGMMETEALHKEHFIKMHDRLKKEFPKLYNPVKDLSDEEFEKIKPTYLKQKEEYFNNRQNYLNTLGIEKQMNFEQLSNLDKNMVKNWKDNDKHFKINARYGNKNQYASYIPHIQISVEKPLVYESSKRLI